MKKYFYLLSACLAGSTLAMAAPGDTTWVQANNVRLTGGGNYDTTINFPAAGPAYRNVYMVFTLGKYSCDGYNPANPGEGAGQTGWCGDWDYTVKNKLMTPGGDTLELGRLITPYANSLAPRTPLTWQQHYVYDVTDYVSKLQGSASTRISFDAGSGGFTANVRFAFIEGTPDRTVTGIEKLWSGSFNYGYTPDINTNFTAISKTAPAGTASTDLKVTVTGHGADATGCCEFSRHTYQVMLNGASVASKLIWRDNCGANELYPQSGTWVYDRGNWCPGAIVYSDAYTLPGITAGSSYNIGLEFDPYTHTGPSNPYYITEGTLINYGPLNKTVDAGITRIIAPTNDENQFRENTRTGSPTIRIKNRGAAPITSMTIQYGLQDSVMSVYNWTGTLASLEEAELVLPQLPALNNIAGASGLFTFISKIMTVNGAADVDNTDDGMTSQFVAGPLWPSPFRIQLRTNNEANPVTGTAETEWKIYDVNNTVIASRTHNTISTTYMDTLNLYEGSYKLEIIDSGCNGLRWWANPAGTTAGTFFVKQYSSNANITMGGYQYSGGYPNDFGCGYSQYFYVSRPRPAGVDNVSANALGMEVYPNPAQGVVNVDISGLDKVKGTIQIIDVMGRVALTADCTSAHQQLSLKGLNTGVYTIQFVNANGSSLKSRLLITK